MRDSLQSQLAVKIAPVVLANLTTRYPYHDAHLYTAGAPSFDAIVAHPAFGNGYDWHSSVHSHWTALQLLAHFAGRGERPPVALELEAAVAANLSPHKIAAESEYLRAYPWYERPYGRAWAMLLAAAALRHDEIRDRAPSLRELSRSIAEPMTAWLGTLPGPVRHGVHSNSAFALGLMHDAAVAMRLDDLRRAIEDRAHAWFARDAVYPHAWDRSAHDFLSSGLAQADLLRRVLPEDAFAAWWTSFLGDAPQDAPIFVPAIVPQHADGQLVHLHGLNLSRAAMLARVAVHRVADRGALVERAFALYRASVAASFGDDYLSTHWLPTFAWDAARSLDALAEI